MRWLFLMGLLITPAVAADLSTDGENAGTTAIVQSLKRSGNAVTLRFTIVNDSNQSLSGNLLSGHDTFTADGSYLVDTTGKKKYEIIRDSDGHCICSQRIPNFQPKSSANLWAKFPAPPDSVTKIGVNIPHFIPLDDVPITE